MSPWHSCFFLSMSKVYIITESGHLLHYFDSTFRTNTTSTTWNSPNFFFQKIQSINWYLEGLCHVETSIYNFSMKTYPIWRVQLYLVTYIRNINKHTPLDFSTVCLSYSTVKSGLCYVVWQHSIFHSII